MMDKLWICFTLILPLFVKFANLAVVTFDKDSHNDSIELLIKKQDANSIKIRQNKNKVTLTKYQNTKNDEHSSQITHNQGMPCYLWMSYEQYLGRYKPVCENYLQSQEYRYRQQIFYYNLNQINQHNRQKYISYTKNINEYADIQQNQFISIYARLQTTNSLSSIQPSNNSPPNPQYNNNSQKPQDNSSKETQQHQYQQKNKQKNANTVPTVTGSSTADILQSQNMLSDLMIDWSCMTSEVMNQGLCGSCYAIAPLQSIYVTYKMYGKDILSLSTQEVLSCSNYVGIYGCLGGYLTNVFSYVMIQGVGAQLLYPYISQSSTYNYTQPCDYSIMKKQYYKKTKVKILSFKQIDKGDCRSVIEQLKVRSIAVAIGTTDFQFYYYGTYNKYSNQSNHGVTLVGYDPKTKGFKIKNSWGITWGQLGYGYVGVESGVCDNAVYPIIEAQTNNSLKHCK